MSFNKNIHHRRSIRLDGYDYASEGLYFITICVNKKECLFGDIVDGKMMLNEFGIIARNEWMKSSEIRSEIELDEFIIMPNHIHGIVRINNPNPSNVGAYGNTPGGENNDRTVAHSKTHNDEQEDHNRAYFHTPGGENNDRTVAHSKTHNDEQEDHNRAYFHTPLRSPSKSIGAMVRGYKSSVTTQINILRNSPQFPVWQRNYYEHIIRNDESYETIKNYILNNPSNWINDQLYYKK